MSKIGLNNATKQAAKTITELMSAVRKLTSERDALRARIAVQAERADDPGALVAWARRRHQSVTQPEWRPTCSAGCGPYPCETALLADALEQEQDRELSSARTVVSAARAVITRYSNLALQDLQQAVDAWDGAYTGTSVHSALIQAERERDAARAEARDYRDRYSAELARNSEIYEQNKAERGELLAEAYAARTEAAALREGLRGLERLKEDGDDWTYCAACKNWMTGHPNAGHDENCVLAPLLAALAPPKPTTDDAPRAGDAITDEQLTEWDNAHKPLKGFPDGTRCRSCGQLWRCSTVQLIAALRAAREPANAMIALKEIRHQLDLRLPSEQVGPEWQRTVRVPVDRLIVVDVVLQMALGEPQHTDELMPPSPTASESSPANYPDMQALVELIKAAKEWRDVISGKLTVPPKGYIDAEGRLYDAIEHYEKEAGG